MSETRVRFAPSPTGSLHVGGARTALYNWFFARGRRGSFVLRMEDTDVTRSSPESEAGVIEDLKWLGVEWEEGPDCGGNYGPYRQSERKDLYKDFAQRLVDSGRAYRCYCTPEELEQRKQSRLSEGRSAHYDGHCLDLSGEKLSQFENEGRRSSIRFKAPDREFVLDDVVRGEVRFPKEMVGDFIILRSDGMPTYNFSCVVDDHLMKITHVIRGEEHLSNTLRQLMLYETLRIEPPTFAHLSILLNRARAKLSKREGAASISEFRKMGYVPEAIVNYLALLGWSPGHDKEIMNREEMIRDFSLERAAKSAAVFDVEKLDWMNCHYIRTLDLDYVFGLSAPFFAQSSLKDAGRETLKKILAATRRGLVKLSDLQYHVSVFEGEIPRYEPDVLGLLKETSSVDVISSAFKLLEASNVSSQGEAKAWLAAVGRETGKKGKELFVPVRAALTGKIHGPELPEVIEILGREVCLRRLKHAIGGQL
ncbi:MAG: glutamate--tRNA ligase [Candidatus Eisenbacteria bacterium]|nr:glutamate--tRNA ligase [Candidatus Eisenbacteria bacterium]